MITDIEQACDRLIVLARGHTLLDLPMNVNNGAGNGFVPAPDGTPLTLVRTLVVALVGAPAGRPATLEEIVIGHLAAGRSRAAAAAKPDEGAAA